jgi:hypothetical protein
MIEAKEVEGLDRDSAALDKIAKLRFSKIVATPGCQTKQGLPLQYRQYVVWVCRELRPGRDGVHPRRNHVSPAVHDGTWETKP